MESKVCCQCKLEKNISEFYPRRERGEKATRSKCKKCCKEDRSKIPKEKQKEYEARSYLKNREKRINKSRKYRADFPEKVLETEKKRRKKHKLKRSKYSSEYSIKRRKTDRLFYLRYAISNNIYMKIKAIGVNKKSKTEEILGCDIRFFKNHIESQFKKGMTWGNHGEWHLDHIKPVSIAKTESELIELNHYTNFQPLWAIDNLRKGNKYTEL